MRKLMHRAIKIHTDAFLVIVFIVVSVFSCKSQKNSNFMQALEPKNGVELLLWDAYFPTDSLVTEVVKDAKTFQNFFAKVNMTRKPGLKVPEVDFVQNNVLIICAGKTETNTFPNLRKLEENATQITFEIEQSKEENISEKQVISYPFSIYKIVKTDKEVIFKNR